MARSKQIDRICVVVILAALLLTILFMNGETFGLQAVSKTAEYESRLFDTSRVHTIDIEMDDWDSFLSTCESEEYTVCSVIIDNEAYKNVALRGKGNTSLTTVSSMDSERYSFKLEFDHYDSTKTYYGLDKLSLNNIIQDNTYMKDYLTYQLMRENGVAAPLCSFVYITVNGEAWGLYLAVEGVEDSFLQRNYGSESGELYKPDSVSMGGGVGNGKGFEMDWDAFDFDDFSADAETSSAETATETENTEAAAPQMPSMPENGEFTMPEAGEFTMPEDGEFTMPEDGEFTMPEDIEFTMPEDGEFTMPEAGSFTMPQGGSMGGGGGMGSDAVKLIYTDDDPDSYAEIFENAKTDITEEDEARLIASLKALSEGEDLESVLDIDALLRYFVVHNFVVNADSYTGSMVHNYYLYESDGVLSMIPWDYNLAFGGFLGNDSSGTVNDPIDTPLSVTGDGSRPMIDWIFQDEEMTALYHEAFAEFLDNTDIIGIIDEAYALIAPYVEKDPTAFCTYEEFETGVETLREFCTLRIESVRGQLDGTIPSTSEGQSADSSTLIDASSITISDMGSMNNGGGGGMGGGQMPEAKELPEGMEAPTDWQPSETETETAEEAETETATAPEAEAEDETAPESETAQAELQGEMQPMPNSADSESQPPEPPNGETGAMQPPTGDKQNGAGAMPGGGTGGGMELPDDAMQAQASEQMPAPEPEETETTAAEETPAEPETEAEAEAPTEPAEAPTAGEAPENSGKTAENRGTMPEAAGGMGAMPGTESAAASPLLLIISAAVLAAGLIFAILFKKF